MNQPDFGSGVTFNFQFADSRNIPSKIEQVIFIAEFNHILSLNFFHVPDWVQILGNYVI